MAAVLNVLSQIDRLFKNFLYKEVWFCIYYSILIYFPGEKKFKCDRCEKAFFTNSALQKHLVKHSATKNYKCDQCTAEFYEKVALKRYEM